MYDVIVIGAGAAGLTAAIYTGRKNLKTLIISVDIGGQTSIPSNIENYPGFDAVNGFELMTKFQTQAMNWGAELTIGKVTAVEKNGETFKLTLATGEVYETKSLILAFGKTPNSLGIPGEDKFMGRGVSTCVTCDGPFYKGKNIAIIGGGNSALGGAYELAEVVNKIYLVHRRDEFRGDSVEVERVKKQANVEFVLSHVPVEILGDKVVQGLVVENVNTHEKKTLQVDGVFVEIGFKVDSDFLGDLVERNERKEIVIDANNQTSCPGIFAAGDVTIVPYKQTVISAGEGAKAALQCYHFFSKDQSTGVDWNH